MKIISLSDFYGPRNTYPDSYKIIFWVQKLNRFTVTSNGEFFYYAKDKRGNIIQKIIVPANRLVGEVFYRATMRTNGKFHFGKYSPC